MPILYSNMIKSYLKIFCLSIFLFISILILMRVQEIAKFATFSSSLSKVVLFTIYQFPLILPMAIPISCLISSIVLIQRMSHSGELTSLRTFRMSFKDIFFPLTALSLFLTLVNFVIIFEITPHSKQLSRNLIYQVTTSNPLALLQTKKISKLQDAYIKMKVKKSSLKAKDLVFAFTHPKTSRIELLTAQELNVETPHALQAKNVDFISYIAHETTLKRADLYLEHENFVLCPVSALTTFLTESETKKTSGQKLSLMPLIKNLFLDGSSIKEKNENLFEIFRRLYLAIGPSILNQTGLIWGIDIGRRPSKIFKFNLVLIAICYFVVYVASKPFKHSPLLGLLIFSSVIASIFLVNFAHKRQLEKGAEKCI